MSKKCVSCGAELADNASFCPHCETEQTEKQTTVRPKLWRKKVFIAALAVFAIAAVVLGISLYHQPKTYEGSAELDYTDSDGSYHLFLCFDELLADKKLQQDTASSMMEADGYSGMPSQLFVYDMNTGADVQDEFFAKVRSCSVETIPDENGIPMDHSEPAKDDFFVDAARVSHIVFNGLSGTNEIRWTLNMKNGDTLILRQTISVTLLETVNISCEGTPMETMEELLTQIENDFGSDSVVNIYLPPVTYEGGLTISGRSVNLFGGTDGENQTTFTGTVTVETETPGMMTISGIRFVGNGGTRLSAVAAVYLANCEFTGWDVAAVANDGSWLITAECIFTDNGIGLHFNSTRCNYNNSSAPGNVFRGNDTAVLLSNIPGNASIDFCDCVFSDNGTNIDNRTGINIYTTNTVLE